MRDPSRQAANRLQLLGLPELPLQRLAHADVADCSGHQDSLGTRQRTQRDLDRKFASILPPPSEFNPRADLLRQSVFGRSKSIGDEPLREALGNDRLHLRAYEFIAAVSELFFRPNIQQDDFSL